MPFAFHKTHKTGSTTLQNILLRHALAHGLNVLTPTRAHAFRPTDTPAEALEVHEGVDFQVEQEMKLCEQLFCMNSLQVYAFHAHPSFSNKLLRQALGRDAVFFTIRKA